MTAPLRTTYAVWELTLACNLACVHCGSRADKARPAELSTAEAFDLVRQMRDAGIAEVTLIGGEAYLRADWLEIVRAIRDAGMICTLTTGGYGISAATARAMADAGLQQVSLSIDGTRRTHDQLRGRTGSWDAAFRSFGHLRDAGLRLSCNTQINRLSAPELPLIYADILAAGCRAWQIGLTVPMGRAADRPELLLQPPELLDLFPLLNELAEQAERDGLLFYPGNNIGYYGPYERRLRAMQGENAIWDGCQAGITSIGIEADGAIKGCPSLPTRPYTGGNIRDTPLAELLQTKELTLNDAMGTPEGVAPLWGFCAGCDYAELCRGGCTWTAHVFFGQRGNNPYCHHRALTQQRRGVRERLSLKTRAGGEPFDHGIFSLIEEPFDAPWPADDPLRFSKGMIQRTAITESFPILP
ncbi:radical SAM additional 4Fe4S-binding SPASM domain-containing protein [Granulicella rosea]|uniref:Radical SAM additional 4Fe4S-binding SPASM domain-containing protein n=1 Tax=Granulicella rosea TaxID=474952 RepID=A0A239DRK2_9BACT|nr:radical SAM protein [Granulicella rosea]SNS34957.1 radical SAM additional 4Fe4S-binding SPASM domain-containing protein [Granulicella rosea]